MTASERDGVPAPHGPRTRVPDRLWVVPAGFRLGQIARAQYAPAMVTECLRPQCHRWPFRFHSSGLPAACHLRSSHGRQIIGHPGPTRRPRHCGAPFGPLLGRVSAPLALARAGGDGGEVGALSPLPSRSPRTAAAVWSDASIQCSTRQSRRCKAVSRRLSASPTIRPIRLILRRGHDHGDADDPDH